MSDAPIDQPLYGATFPQAIGRLFRKYATFSGRASRSEYWWAYLLVMGGQVLLATLTLVLGVSTGTTSATGTAVMGPGGAVVGIASIIWFLATIVPIIAVAVRRLHDADYSGAIYLLVLVPSIGGIILLILLTMRSNPLGVRFDKGTTQPAPPVAA